MQVEGKKERERGVSDERANDGYPGTTAGSGGVGDSMKVYPDHNVMSGIARQDLVEQELDALKRYLSGTRQVNSI